MTSFWLIVIMSIGLARAALDSEATVSGELIVALPIIFWLSVSMLISINNMNQM